MLDAARSLLHSSEGPVCASLTTLGEAFIKAEASNNEPRLSADDLEGMARRLRSYLDRGLLSLCGLGCGSNDPKPFRLALEIAQADEHLKRTDVMILASAMACREADVLYTGDSDLLGFDYLVREIAERHDARCVSITEAPGTRQERHSRRRGSRP